ncbi:hypothetical protein A3E46_02405 [Candidatus Woesebacteria bacterium RIFCSPHIGHO2_12_FULL_46_16]|uniref:Uncharacterized protein n=1 Tax=Candidatus Woesebacteria bacterium RIFCSPHIGHO2_12_FULL_46_16 TaxID=1802513 RepID=A0A1F8AXD7_9BACT|nr:MAG: hypothetical protein A3E46_02405 [Candidatus Woesebacteria bacterium RIFCSPHIGHO2_12_FULL_46_16]
MSPENRHLRVVPQTELAGILTLDNVRLLKVFPSEDTNHVASLYEIKPTTPPNPIFTCSHCEEQGKFLIDHKGDGGEHTLYASCGEHSIPSFGMYLESVTSA